MTTYTGSPLKRFEDPRLLKGSGNFIDDFRLPGMLHAAILRSPHAHAYIRSIDTTAASQLPGVVAVLTGQEMKERQAYMPTYVPINTPAYMPARPPGAESEILPFAQPLLAIDRVRYVGEPVAIVVAHDLPIARDAVELVQVNYQTLPVVLDLEQSLKGAVLLHEDLNSNVLHSQDREEGDLEGIFRQADKIVKGSFEAHRRSPAPMETRGVVAVHDPENDMLTMWGSLQAPHMFQAEMAYALHRERSSIRVIAPDVGGGFGQKARSSPDAIAICYLAIKLGRPVKWIEDRTENMSCYHGRGMSCRAEAAVRKDGTILALRFNVLCDIGAYFTTSSPVNPAVMARESVGPYRIPVAHIHIKGVATNKPITGPYRGAGGPEAAYFLERTMDLIAGELDLDPVEVRKRNLVPSESIPYTTATKSVYDAGEFPQVLDKALNLADYVNLRRLQARARAEGRLVGIGVATVIKGSGGAGAYDHTSMSRLEIGRDGHVLLYTEISPHGQGTETTFAQIAADALGIRPQDVTLLHGDTDMVAEGAGTRADRGVILGGSSAYQVAHQARDRIARIAAHLFGCSPEDVELADGTVFPRHQPQKAVPFREIVARAFQEETLPPGVPPGLEFANEFHLPHPDHSFAALVVAVEVDRDTGQVRLDRYVGVYDCGRVINPRLVEGQLHGGIAQGLGEALSEAVLYSPDGQPATGTLMDYALPFAEDFSVPTLETHQTLSTINPLGTKGVGEIPAVGTPAAIANAVVDALSPLGVRHLDSPYTPEKVWKAITTAQLH